MTVRAVTEKVWMQVAGYTPRNDSSKRKRSTYTAKFSPIDRLSKIYGGCKATEADIRSQKGKAVPRNEKREVCEPKNFKCLETKSMCRCTFAVPLLLSSFSLFPFFCLSVSLSLFLYISEEGLYASFQMLCVCRAITTINS